ncbi:MAG: hypothetical protein P8X92_07660 [Dehalococcoidia bacterium]|jgi:hypothetical protein
MNTSEWLQRVKEVLSLEGFNDTFLQVRQSGQVFGLVKKLDNIWQMHVRGFNDERLEAEIEVSNDYFEHLDENYRRDATPELRQILDAYQIPYQSKGSLPQMGITLDPPNQLTPWKPLVAIVAVAGFLVWLGRQKE